MLAGCRSDTTAIEVAPIGRNTDMADVEDEADEDGLPACDDVATLTPGEDGTPVGSISLDREVLMVLADYGAENPETYAGLWLDARYAGAPVVAFVDDPVRHREALLRRLSTDDDGMPFGLAKAEHSLRELEVLAAELPASIPTVRSAAADPILNRVTVTMLDPSEADLEQLAAPTAAGLVCIDIETSPPRPEGPLDVLPRDDRVDLLSCGEEPFPESALTGRAPVADSAHPAAAAMGRFTGDDGSVPGAESDQDRRLEDWIVLDIGSDRALFGKFGDGLEATASVVGTGSTWEVEGWSFGCELRVGLPRGLAAVEVFLDPASPPRPEDSGITVLVSELACAGGEEMGDRLLGPQVVEDAGQVLLAFAAVARSLGDQDCPGNPRTAVTVELARPLGNRTVLDGMSLPPRPLVNP